MNASQDRDRAASVLICHIKIRSFIGPHSHIPHPNDILKIMDQEKLAAAQIELMRHHWDTFCTEPLSIAEGGKGVIVPGCTHCRKLLYTNNQYLSHLALDVLPKILEEIVG